MEDNGQKYTAVAAIPMLQQEVKTYLKGRHSADEARAIKYLATEIAETSAAGKIYRVCVLNRRVIRGRRKAMARNRTLQVPSNNLVGGTRFKMLQGS